MTSPIPGAEGLIGPKVRQPIANWLALVPAAVLPLPWALVSLQGASPSPLATSALTGLAILGAAFLLSWAAEAYQVEVSQAFALGLLALIAVLPEYAVDAAFAWKAAEDPAYAGYAVANMTGANRLLIGVGWSAIVLVTWLRHGANRVEIGPDNAVELCVLLAATVYALTIPLKGTLSALDTLVLGAMFAFYAWAVSRGPAAQPHLIGPAASIGHLPARWRRLVNYALFLYAAGAIFVSAKPFAQGLVQTGLSLGVDEFLLVQWLAPLASEAPEFLVALLFAWRAQAAAGLRTMVSSKVNQWTLLIATLPLVYSVAKGTPAALPLDNRQVQELLLTAAQSLFATVIIAKLSISRTEALLLFGLFVVQLALPTETVRWAITASYFLLGWLFVVRDRRARDGLRRLPSLLRSSLCVSAEAARGGGNRPA